MKKSNRIVTCAQCRWSELLDYGHGDPIIARCPKKPDPYFNDYFRDVASSPKYCDLFMEFKGIKKIKKEKI